MPGLLRVFAGAIAAVMLAGSADAQDRYCETPSISIDRPDLAAGEVDRLCRDAASFWQEDYIVSGTTCTLCPAGSIRTTTGPSTGSGGGPTASGTAVDAYGKYCDMIDSYHCPNDAGYTPYTDYGYWRGGDDDSFSQSGLPAGYYVYETDTWYIYDRNC